jgi:hypothetical protein
MTIIKKAKITNAGKEEEEKGELLYTAGRMKGRPLCKAIWRFLKNVKIQSQYDPAIPLLGIYPKEMKSLHTRDACTPLFIVALFTIAKIWNRDVH